MCLTLPPFETRGKAIYAKRGKIATEDILVFKVLTNDGYGPYYQDFIYERGYHYYQTNPKFTFSIHQCSWNDKWQLEIHQGLHSCKTINKADDFLASGVDRKIVKMIIPKGAKYFESGGEYVSDQLIYY